MRVDVLLLKAESFPAEVSFKRGPEEKSVGMGFSHLERRGDLCIGEARRFLHALKSKAGLRSITPSA